MRHLNATAIIRRLATHTNLVGTHRAAASLAGGIAVPGATTTFTIDYAVVAPTPGKELQRLPELRRAQESKTIYTAGAVLVGSQAGTSEADLVTIDGAVYEVSLASEWNAAAGYYSAIVTRANLPG